MLVASWHSAHWVSSALAPPTWPVAVVPTALPAATSASLLASVIPLPVAKSMPSWQAPQAMRLGNFFQLSPSAVLLALTEPSDFVAEPSWHLVQLRCSCGKPTRLKHWPRFVLVVASHPVVPLAFFAWAFRL